jgi:protocatechuate 3,4-dioxygenase beta subunit
MTSNCTPVAGAKVDIWQADADGQYDNTGYRLRGYVLTDQAGRYTIETIVPGLYTGRTGHIHVKVQAPGGPVLTTQLYFPGVAQNSSDSIYDARMLLTVRDGPSGKTGLFTFVLPRS